MILKDAVEAVELIFESQHEQANHRLLEPRLTADTAYKRQAKRVVREHLGVKSHITAKPRKQKTGRRRLQKARLQTHRFPLVR